MYIRILLFLTLILSAHSADPSCETGILSGKSCCPSVCGICGGLNCGVRTRLTRTMCCKGAIQASPRNCLTSSPPCKITVPPGTSAASDTPDPSCEAGLVSRGVCCPPECSVCGGSGCLERSRLIRSNCCVGSIRRRGRDCSSTGAPCVIGETTPVEVVLTPVPGKVEEKAGIGPVEIPVQMPNTSAEVSVASHIATLPRICAVKIRPVIGCFCYITLKRIVDIRKRYLFIKHCMDTFTRKEILGMAEECDMYVHGPTAEMHISYLTHEVNLIIPECYPPMTPLVSFKPVMWPSYHR